MHNAEGAITGWDDDDEYWRKNYRTRPYALSTSDYDSWRGGYRYGYEAAGRYRGRDWNDVEHDLSRGWDRYEHRGASTWEQIKGAVRDAWDRATSRPLVTK